MVIIIGEDDTLDTCSLLTCCRQRSGGRQSQKYVPDEIWHEIISRLPIKPLFISRCVCKSWRNSFATLENKFDTDPLFVPLCGLFLLSFRSNDDYSLSYFCLRTKNNFSIRYDCPENNSVYSSGFERGLLSDLTFDFSIMQNLACDAFEYVSGPHFRCFVMNGGLLLITLGDGTSRVHNPATKQIYFVPKSPTVEKYGGLDHYTNGQKPGLIIQFPSHLNEQRCRFIVVRFCTQMGIMEVYHAVTRMWRKYCLELDNELLSLVHWRFQNYVALIESEVVSLYVLTGKNCGIAIKFNVSMDSEMKHYSFPLPEVVHGGYSNARIWECEKSLYLSYYSATALWIWKAGSTQIDAWAWVPMLEISSTRLSCKPVAREHLSKVVFNDSVPVKPLACHPMVAVVYLLVKSSIFTYNLNTDTLDVIGDMKDYDHKSDYFAFTFKPYLSFMDAGEESCRDVSATETRAMEDVAIGGVGHVQF